MVLTNQLIYLVSFKTIRQIFSNYVYRRYRFHQNKGMFFQKVLAKFSNFSKCHSCEPKIVPELLIPVNDNNKILIILVIKSPHVIWLKNANYMGEFNALQLKLFRMLAKSRNYRLYPTNYYCEPYFISINVRYKKKG